MAATLTAKALRRLLSYDPETGEFVWLQTMSCQVLKGSMAGTRHGTKYRIIKIRGTQFQAHRLAWLYMTGEWPDGPIDHINRDVADNRWTNLRLATPSQNAMNTGISSHNTSGRRGVNWHKEQDRWSAVVQKDGEQHHLGRFDSPEEAQQAYQAKAYELFGEFVSP